MYVRKYDCTFVNKLHTVHKIKIVFIIRLHKNINKQRIWSVTYYTITYIQNTSLNFERLRFITTLHEQLIPKQNSPWDNTFRVMRTTPKEIFGTQQLRRTNWISSRIWERSCRKNTLKSIAVRAVRKMKIYGRVDPVNRTPICQAPGQKALPINIVNIKRAWHHKRRN